MLESGLLVKMFELFYSHIQFFYLFFLFTIILANHNNDQDL